LEYPREHLLVGEVGLLELIIARVLEVLAEVEYFDLALVAANCHIANNRFVESPHSGVVELDRVIGGVLLV
jgi:hypothetical protein